MTSQKTTTSTSLLAKVMDASVEVWGPRAPAIRKSGQPSAPDNVRVQCKCPLYSTRTPV